jgi:3-phenylpropionate/trans-cinnamate dioxygenase ferredoxin reductase subunit
MVIVGAGQAGAWVARTLRSEGYEGAITLIGEEHAAPYSRPPLSKEILAGADPDAVQGLFLLDAAFARDNAIDLRLGLRGVVIERSARRLLLENGDALPYDTLFIATGSRARLPPWLPEGPGGRVHVLRTLDDALRLRAQLVGGRRLIVVGGGWIGLEAAAAARGLGLEAIVLEAAPRLCARSVPEAVSAYLLDIHRQAGVEVRLGAMVAAMDPHGVTAILNDASEVTGDLCLVGIGNIPNVELALDAGLDVGNGIVVDAYGRASDPHIFAVGDVANLPCALCRTFVRRESWANAQNQAIAAAKAALGQDAPYRDLPWLWSDQYGRNIQIVGAPERGARHLYRAPGAWLSLDDAGVIGAVAIDSPRDLRAVRKALSGGPPIDLGAWAPV